MASSSVFRINATYQGWYFPMESVPSFMLRLYFNSRIPEAKVKCIMIFIAPYFLGSSTRLVKVMQKQQIIRLLSRTYQEVLKMYWALLQRKSFALKFESPFLLGWKPTIYANYVYQHHLSLHTNWQIWIRDGATIDIPLACQGIIQYCYAWPLRPRRSWKGMTSLISWIFGAATIAQIKMICLA